LSKGRKGKTKKKGEGVEGRGSEIEGKDNSGGWVGIEKRRHRLPLPLSGLSLAGGLLKAKRKERKTSWSFAHATMRLTTIERTIFRQNKAEKRKVKKRERNLEAV